MPAQEAALSYLTAATSAQGVRSGSRQFRQTSWAMFTGGFATFALLYSAQSILPQLARDFAVSPAQSSTVVSAATGALALALLPASALSNRYGRKPLMLGSLLSAALLTLLMALSHGFGQLVALRALLGLVLAGLPAVAMAYLSEEIDAGSLGLSMGLYIGGNALGGMCGRFVMNLLTEVYSWRVAFGVLGVAGLLAAFEFWRSLPASRRFTPLQPQAGHVRATWHSVRELFRDPGLPLLFSIGFMLMGTFVSLYNYLAFRLEAAPFHLRPSMIGAVFSLYLVGIVASTWAGRLADRIGRRQMLWWMVMLMLGGLLLTLSDALLVVVLGIALVTFGFFGAHSVASSWVGRRAGGNKALASALYLFSYYIGSSVVGSLSGLLWTVDGWFGVACALAAALVVCLWIALRLRKLAPLA
jgi:YNFM family putative membrane transporter